MSRRGTAALVLAIAVAAVGWRIVHRLDDTTPPFSREAALVDFRDAVYYPVVAFLDGENPYDHARVFARYPINGTIGLYSPLTLVLHAPFGLLPYRAAELAFVVWSMALVVVLAWVAWRVYGGAPDPALVLGLAAVLVVTRPGHWNLVVGQVALEAGLATIAALWLAPTRPWLAGLALAVSTFKPTYGLPLFVLLAARREWPTVRAGIVAASVLTMIPLVEILARVGIGPFVQSVLRSYEERIDTPHMSAANSTFRVDLVALFARSLGHAPDLGPALVLTVLVLVIAALALRRLALRDDADAARRGLAIASLAIVLCTYHQQYDLVVLAPLLVSAWPLASFRRAQWPAALVSIPFLNYFASGGLQRLIDLPDAEVLWVSSVNIVALVAAFALLVVPTFRTVRSS